MQQPWYTGYHFLQHYFQSGNASDGISNLVVEWTNQHGCGGDEDNDPHKLNCNLVLQYMCQPGDETDTRKFSGRGYKLR